MSVASPADPHAAPGPQADRLAWIGHANAAVPGLARQLHVFEDSDDFLLCSDPAAHDMFIVGLQQRGMSGLSLLKVLRRARPCAPLIALDDPVQGDFVGALEAGADMVLRPFSPPDHLRAAIASLRRRCPDPSRSGPWRLHDCLALVSPCGVQLGLSTGESRLLSMLCDARGAVVPRGALLQALWPDDHRPGPNALHATVYRLRRRVEAAGAGLLPLVCVSPAGYAFHAPLQRV